MHKMHNKQEKEPISSKGTEETICQQHTKLLYEKLNHAKIPGITRRSLIDEAKAEDGEVIASAAAAA